MKRIRMIVATLVLTLALTLLTGVALAAEPTVTEHLGTDWQNVGRSLTLFDIRHNGSDYTWQIVRVDPDSGKTSTAYIPNGYVYENAREMGSVTITWYPDVIGDDQPNRSHKNGLGVVHRLIVTDLATNKRQVFNFFVDAEANGNVRVRAAGWMTNNTVCSFGPHFKDYVRTDKWYMFTPIDLTLQGMQSFEMVAGGMYKIGTVNVTVSGDTFWVEYTYVNPSEIYNKGEFFTIFGGLNQVTTVDPNKLTSMTYGQPYSITRDLGGDTNVLLFTCNHATFLNSTTGIERFYENIDWRKNLREEMIALMNRPDMPLQTAPGPQTTSNTAPVQTGAPQGPGTVETED